MLINRFGMLLLVAGVVGACQPPEPAQCVCNCEGPPPEGAIVKIKEQPAEEKKATAPTPAAAPAPAAAAAPAAPAAPARVAPPARVPRKARGRVSAEPGSGVPKVMSDADKTEMKDVFLQFAKASKSRNLGEMQKTTTERLGKSLEASLDKYAERLYRRTDLFSKGAESGVTPV